MDAVRDSIIASHNKLIQELEVTYSTYITALFQQKAFIHQKIQENLYKELFKIDNIATKHTQNKPQISSNRKNSEAQIKSHMEQPNVDNIEKLTEKHEKHTKDTESLKQDKIILPVGADHKSEAELLKRAGNKLLKQKKYQRSIVEYTKAINLNPLNAIYYANRATAYIKLRHYAKAVIDSRQASMIDHTYIKAYAREAFAEYQMNHYQNAYDIYQNALRIASPDKNKRLYQQMQDGIKLCQTGIQDTTQNKLVDKNRRGKVLSECNKTFKQNQCLQKHMAQHIYMYITSKQAVCPHCNKPFGSKQALLKHVENNHTVIINTKGSELQLFDCQYPCSECNISFQTQLELETHIKQHGNVGLKEMVCSSNKRIEVNAGFNDGSHTKQTKDDKSDGRKMQVIYPQKCSGNGFLYTYNSEAGKVNKFICKSMTDTGDGFCNRKFVQKCHLTKHCLEKHQKR